MPTLSGSEWYDLTRDMNWTPRYAREDDIWPEAQSKSVGIPASAWWTWDEPYKLTYREYVHNQVDKDTGVYAVNSVIARSKLFEGLDLGWRSAIVAHYGAVAIGEYLAALGESRMGRLGRAAAWRNMATFGTLDETRHGQIQAYFPYSALAKEPRLDWAHKTFHANERGGDRSAVALRRHVYGERRRVNGDSTDVHLRDWLHQSAVPRAGRRCDEGGGR